ncbi:helix-turn-helix domain-containing protein [Achromobacter sp. ESBL13]|uniref:helix-turn-helix domain-containing protein n=1 Tax=Achromobacter sp. ESBL13 TaxID=3077328 RepID=UPI002FCC9684
MDLHHFKSLDSYADAIFDAQARVFLLGRGGGGWHISRFDIDGFDLQQGSAAVSNVCEAVCRSTHLTLLLSQPSPAQAWLNGAPLNAAALGILAPGKGYVFRAAGPNEWISIALPLDADRFTGDGLMAQTFRRWRSAGGMEKTDPLQWGALREAALMAMTPACPAAIGRRLIERRLFDLMACRFPNDPCKGRPSSSLALLCDATLTVFRERNQNAHVEDIRRGLKISERSLRDFFQTCFGIGPGHYLCLRKLHDVYWDLASGKDTRMTVADCFLQHGYSYSTHSAAQYRALFLETPSATRLRFHPQ